MPRSIVEITSSGELEALRPEWSSLWDRCPQATPFQTPEWLWAWWRHLFRGGKLWTLALRDNGRLAGLAPLFIYGEVTRRAAMVGAGITDYHDILVEPGIAREGADLILRHIMENGARWDECEWGDLNPESALAMDGADDTACPVLELPGSYEELLNGLPSKFRADVRRAQNRLSRIDGARLERARPEETPEFLDALFRLHTAAWEARNETGVLACPEMQAFHREAADGLLKRGCLRLWGLRMERELQAVIYGFAARGRVYAYLGGFNPVLAKLSPGRVLMGYAIRDSIEQGIREFDFLRGSEEYKYLWGARDRMTRRLTFRHA